MQDTYTPLTNTRHSLQNGRGSRYSAYACFVQKTSSSRLINMTQSFAEDSLTRCVWYQRYIFLIPWSDHFTAHSSTITWNSPGLIKLFTIPCDCKRYIRHFLRIRSLVVRPQTAIINVGIGLAHTNRQPSHKWILVDTGSTFTIIDHCLDKPKLQQWTTNYNSYLHSPAHSWATQTLLEGILFTICWSLGMLVQDYLMCTLFGVTYVLVRLCNQGFFAVLSLTPGI